MEDRSKDEKSRIGRVDPALVQDNQVLALSVNRQEVDQSIHFIREYGLLTPPVVGQLRDGSCRVLSGEREFLALREMGVRTTDAVMVLVREQEEMDRLALLLSTLRQAPNPLSEGMLVQQILKTGCYTQAQVGDLLGKSVSWVNKRLSLATRLHPAVRSLVTERQLCAHSAQSIAKLPEQAQTRFAQKALLEGLSKSAVEVLVSAYNRPGCTDSFRTHVLEEPRHALHALAENKAVRCGGAKENHAVGEVPAVLRSLRSNLTLLLSCMRDAERELARGDDLSVSSMPSLIHMCRQRCTWFSALLSSKLPFTPEAIPLISQGKTSESEVPVHGH